jgi:hypothetical protein
VNLDTKKAVKAEDYEYDPNAKDPRPAATNCLSRQDFQQEVVVPGAAAAFADDAVLKGTSSGICAIASFDSTKYMAR